MNIKSIFKWAFILFSIFLIVSFGSEIILGYLNTHKYYGRFLSDYKNWLLILIFSISSIIPILYIIFSKNKKFLIFLLYFLFGQLISGILFISIQNGQLTGGVGAIIIFIINLIVVFSIILVFILGILSLGVLIKKLLFGSEENNVSNIILNLGIGLIAFLFFNYVLIITKLFFSIICWLQIVGFIYLILKFKNTLIDYVKILFNCLNRLQYLLPEKKRYDKNTEYELVSSKWKRIFSVIGVILLMFSIMYFFYGYILAYIPYPTAWDANHAYMFYPKIWALNNGYYRGDLSLAAVPYIWYAYIAFFFNLFIDFDGFFWISVDTIAVVLNFLSGPMVLIFGLALVKEFIDVIGNFRNKWEVKYLSKKNNFESESAMIEYQKKEPFRSFLIGKFTFLVGRLSLLIWLTSGMGAFLVFVDNKTDLGILALIILALYSGIIFIRKHQENETVANNESLNKDNIISKIFKISPKLFFYIALSGIFFATAHLAKPTAMLDIMSFGLLMLGLWIGFFSSFGFFFLVVGILGVLGFKDTGIFITQQFGYILLFVGSLLIFLGLILNYKKLKKYFKFMLIWGFSLFIVLLLFKGSFILFSNFGKECVNTKSIFEGLIFGTNNIECQKKPSNLVASTCNDTQISSDESKLVKDGQLYYGLKKAIGDSYSEDVGRYTGYGRREFNDPWWKFIFNSFENKCIGINLNAVTLCNNYSKIHNYEITELKTLKGKLKQNSDGYNYLNNFIKVFESLESINDESEIKKIKEANNETYNELKNYIENNSIKVEKTCYIAQGSYKAESLKSTCKVYESPEINTKDVILGTNIYIPYNYLKIFNITFNWSLQNESSYYTDIGFYWLILIFFIFVGFLYGLGRGNKILSIITGISLLGWFVWILIGGGILWYGIGLIVWTILSFMTYIYIVFHDVDSKKQDIGLIIFVLLIFAVGIYQIKLNYFRISTQGGSGPFMEYKAGVGKKVLYTDKLEPKEDLVYGYSNNNIFDLQFPHYKNFINMTDSRNEGEVTYLAGTYARYFLSNQKDIIYDQMLSWLWELFSDWDEDKIYKRLKDKKIKYIAIDPNIGTVVMGGGNMSLFHRFFAKINMSTGKFENDGVLTMLAKLSSKGYIKYRSGNNIGIKYAYLLSDEELRKYLGDQYSDEDMHLVRAKIATIRYWPSNQNLYNVINSIALNRILNLQFITDIAEIYGKQIDENKLIKMMDLFIRDVLKTKNISLVLENYKNNFDTLTLDELNVFAYFYRIYFGYTSSNESAKQVKDSISGLINSSITASSQILVFEVN